MILGFPEGRKKAATRTCATKANRTQLPQQQTAACREMLTAFCCKLIAKNNLHHKSANISCRRKRKSWLKTVTTGGRHKNTLLKLQWDLFLKFRKYRNCNSKQQGGINYKRNSNTLLRFSVFDNRAKVKKHKHNSDSTEKTKPNAIAINNILFDSRKQQNIGNKCHFKTKL